MIYKSEGLDNLSLINPACRCGLPLVKRSRPHRLTARTPDSHSGNRSSILLGVTDKNRPSGGFLI